MASTEFLTVKELSAYIRVKPGTLYLWVKKKIIPHYQLEGVIRFKKIEIDQWLIQHRKTG